MPVVLNYSKQALTVAGVTIPAGAGREAPGWEQASKSGVIKAWARAGLLVLAEEPVEEPVAEPDQTAQAEPDHEPAAESAQAAAEPAEPAATSERGWLSWR